MLEQLIKLKQGKNSVSDFCDSIRQGIPLATFGVTDPFKCLLISLMEEKVVFVVKDSIIAKKYKEEIEQLSNKKVVTVFPKEPVLTVSKAFSKDITYGRITSLDEISVADVIIVTIDALLSATTKRINKIELEKQKSVNVDFVVKTLIDLGYKRYDGIDGKGSFALKGDILDIFAINYENPVRIDFFGDEIEAIKFIDVESRKSICTLSSVKILQCQEFVFKERELQGIKSRLRDELKGAGKKAHDRLLQVCDDVYFAIEKNDLDVLQIFGPLSENFGSLFDYFDDDSVFIFDESKKSYDFSQYVIQEFKERYDSLLLSGETFSFAEKNLFTYEFLKEHLKKYRLVAMQTLSTTIPYFNPLKIISPEVSGVINYQLKFEEVFTDVDNWLAGGYDVVICTGDNKRSQDLSFELSKQGIASEINGENISGVCISDESLANGFIFHEDKLCVIGSGNLFKKPNGEKNIKPRRSTFFTAPEAGDYCVHELHGIGRVLGCGRISTTEGTKDYVNIEYSGGDILHIPVEQLDILTRYLGSDKKPKLSKIGGADFEKIKRSVKESIKKMSFDLKKLYAERDAKLGFKFNVYEDLENEFAKDFNFEETPDQLSADEDIKKDMESCKVMDRLVCGDVGFGKTEVAFKAIFRAITNGKQAVLLAPTTILTEQHFNTAKERFKRFGVKIACLNRFRTASEVKNILERLKNGDIDLIIGTHRLLGKDVEFKDLGILVLDEEQRFGVEHKEKIKLMKKNVDTLTLTATPIPRTLHMSLSGIRSISVIATPPKKRLPVQIYVTEETDSLIKDAISKEINRGGQAFILYNRVESISSFSKRIQSIMPELKIAVAHGQMQEKTLENIIIDFYNGKYDVLISTTIIENGIDLPKANTLIVIDADRLGLSSLYQLKGRVGRSDRLAYAYFTFKRDKVLTQTAYERLNTIIEFTEMGSGIKVAMRDLEIRGAGNILGAEQHGHMDKVGYELYSKLLREEMEGTEEVVPELDLRISAYIPENYIESNSLRMSVYKEIAEIEQQADANEICRYLTETFGKIPHETINLIEISIIKRLAMKINATKIQVSKSKACITLSQINALKNQKLFNLIQDSRDFVTISMSEQPCLEFSRIKKTNEEMLMEIKNFLIKATN